MHRLRSVDQRKTKKKPLTGYIGLQDSHSPKGHYIQYRNIRIKTLSNQGEMTGPRS
ncbi:MAG: hypothetical protein CM1200mP2_28180 [Planctomycetaceae bacterium]|nr:MAG: hypothetical protein CM1200mP2_28180 [Planctomycetaceae bacterium]